MKAHIVSALVVMAALQVSAANAVTVSYNGGTVNKDQINGNAGISVSETGGVVSVDLVSSSLYKFVGSTTPAPLVPGVAFNETAFTNTGITGATPLTETFSETDGNVIKIFYTGASVTSFTNFPATTGVLKLTGYFTVNGLGAYAVLNDSLTVITSGGVGNATFVQFGTTTIPAITPVPGGLLLFSSALVGAGILLRRRKTVSGVAQA